MRPTVRAASAVTAIALALGPAAAMEEKATKPRIAVIEFANRPNAQLQVDSAQWGEWIADVEHPQAAGRGIDIARVDGEIVAPGSTAGKQPTTRPLVLVPGSSKPRPAASGQIGDPEDMNIGVGELQEDPGGDPDRPIVAGRVPNPRDPASGQATGKRQHKPVLSRVEGPLRARTYYDAPLPRGSVTLRLARPWAGCAVGDRFNGVYLTTGATHRYRLDGAEVARCGGSTVTINYVKSAPAGELVR